MTSECPAIVFVSRAGRVSGDVAYAADLQRLSNSLELSGRVTLLGYVDALAEAIEWVVADPDAAAAKAGAARERVRTVRDARFAYPAMLDVLLSVKD